MSEATDQASASLDLPYVTPDLPGTGGVLRAQISDFVVEEIPLYEPQGEGQHLYVNVTKEALTTKDVQKQLANLFELNVKNVGFAGMKDKYARTTQTFSLNLGYIDASQVADAAQRIRDHLPVQLNWVKQHKNKLKPGHLLGNRFTIRITDTSVSAEQAQARAQTIVDQLQQSGVPNYFGPQRFGPGGANIARGRAILLKKRYTKDRWLRRFLISSYQSYLCNLYLARRVEMGAFDRLLLGDIAKKHDTGGIFDVEDLAPEQERYARQEISFTAPIFGPKMRTPSGPALDLENAILDQAEVTLENLRAARVEGTRRLGRLLLPDIAVATVHDFDKIDTSVTDNLATDNVIITFTLPKGAFATTVLREIMKVDGQEDQDAVDDDSQGNE